MQYNKNKMKENRKNSKKKENKKQLLPQFCSAMCSNVAVGNLKVAEKTSLPVCELCRQKIDPEHKFEFVSFTTTSP